MLLKRRSRLLMAMAVPITLAFISALVALAADIQTLQRVADDPVSSGAAQHRTLVEPHAYAFGTKMCAAYQLGRFADGGAERIGVSCTTDGSTWTNRVLPGTTAEGGTWPRMSDPWVAYSVQHDRWIVQVLLIDAAGTPGGLGNSFSTDDGQTWSDPSTPIPGTEPDFPDKNSIACDNTASSPHYGQCYTQFDFHDLGNTMAFVTSGDGGVTWGSVQLGTLSGIGGYVVVKPDGNVSVPFRANCLGGACIAHYRSTDGGATWTAPASGFLTRRRDVRILRELDMPAAAAASDGLVHVAFHGNLCPGGKNEVVWYAASGVDDGFGTPMCLPLGAGSYALPALAVDPASGGSTAKIGVVAYEITGRCRSPSTCNLTAVFTKSMDGGTTWSGKQALAGPFAMNLIADTASGRMVGDYIGMSPLDMADGQKYIPFFSDGFAPPAGVAFDQPGVTYTGLHRNPVVDGSAPQDVLPAPAQPALVDSVDLSPIVEGRAPVDLPLPGVY